MIPSSPNDKNNRILKDRRQLITDKLNEIESRNNMRLYGNTSPTSSEKASYVDRDQPILDPSKCMVERPKHIRRE